MQRALDRSKVPALREIYREPGHRCYGVGNVVIVHSVDEPDTAYMERNTSAMRRYVAEHATGLGVIVVIPEAAKPPTESGRRALRAGYTAMKNILRAGVLIIEGEGFAAAAKRSAFTILNLASPLPFPIKVAATPFEAASKLVELLGAALEADLDAPLLAASVDQVRRG